MEINKSITPFYTKNQIPKSEFAFEARGELKTSRFKDILKRLNTENVFRRLDSMGDILFLTLGGSDNFGFPSRNSDIDVRGAYISPTKNFLGIDKQNKKTFEYVGKGDNPLDVSLDEIGHFIKLISKSNGNRLEWINSDCIIYKSANFENLKKVVNTYGISKDLSNHYLNFSRDMWKGKTKEEGVKKDLYALRTYMAGINLFENKEVIPDLNKLNKRFDYPIINTMIEEKQKDEYAIQHNYNKNDLSSIIHKLDERLLSSAKKSELPQKPNVFKLNQYLEDLRKDKL